LGGFGGVGGLRVGYEFQTKADTVCIRRPNTKAHTHTSINNNTTQSHNSDDIKVAKTIEVQVKIQIWRVVVISDSSDMDKM
jgi:hypothetical protein